MNLRNRLLAALLLAGSAIATAQTPTSVSVALPNGQTATIPVTVSLGTPVLSGTATTGTGGTGTVTPPPPVTTSNCSGLTVGTNPNPNGWLPATIAAFTQDITSLPVNTALNTAWQKEYCGGGCDHFHLDNTIPVSVVNGGAKVTIAFSDAADSDNVGYPISTDTPTEGGIIGTTVNGKKVAKSGDHHAIVIDKSTCTDYEVYQLSYASGKWTGFAGEAWNAAAQDIRLPGRNSADAAGLPIYPGLINYDEAASGTIGHALRFTMNNTNTQFIYPATHSAGGGDSAYPGMRIRLMPSFVTSTYSPRVQAVMNALKKYGAFVADNGTNFYFTGTSDGRWTSDEMTQLSNLTEGVFEVVDTGIPQSLPQ